MKKRINVILEESIFDYLDQMANERGLSRSALLSVLIWNEANNPYEDFYNTNTLEVHRASRTY